MKSHVDPVAAAEAVLEQLAAKRDAALDRQEALESEMRAKGFAAHAENDGPSQKRLREIGQELGLVNSELIGLDAAADTARARLAGARREAERQAKIERVAEVRALIKPLREAAAATASHLNQFLGAYDQLHQMSDVVRQTGLGRWPRGESFNVLIRDSLQAALRPRHLASEPARAGSPRQIQQVVERYIDELQASLQRAIDPNADPVEVEEEAA